MQEKTAWSHTESTESTVEVRRRVRVPPSRERLQGGGAVEDLARWYAALDTGTLVRPEVQQEGFTVRYLNGGQSTGLRLRLVLNETLGQERQSHGGWWKGYGNIVVRWPWAELTVVILSNDEAFAPRRNEMADRTRLHIRDALSFPQRPGRRPAWR